MREWKELFFNQMPIYEQAAAPQQSPTEVLQDDVELAKENMLNAQDYHNYQMMTGDWHPPDDGEIKGPPANNNVLGHVVGRIMEALCPSIQPSSPPVLPPFPIKACVMGKLLTGKTSCLEQLAEGLNIQAIHPDRLLWEAVLAFNEGEVTSPTEDRAEEPSARAQLGERAAKFLRKGKSVPDELMVEIIVEYLRQLPVQCGWILDGFPVSSAQAKLLEKALTGVDPDKTLQTTKRYRTELVVDIKAPKEPSPPQPALDVAILLEVSDHTVLTRHFTSSASQGAESESQNPSSQQETKDVPGPIKRLPLSEEQLFPRLTGFLESWPELEKWFERQGILVKVNGELEQAELLERLEDVLVETLFKKHTGDAVTEKLSGVLTPGQVGTPPSPPPQDMAPKDGNLPGSGSLSGPTSAREPSDVSPNDKKQGLSGSLLQKDSVSRLSSAKGQSKKKPSTSPGDRKQSKSGVAKEKKGKSEAQLSEIASEPEDSQPPAPKPGSNQWVYVDEPVPQEVATYLARYWDSIVETYTGTIHRVMRELRSERDRVIQDLHAFRRDFQEYVETRPDHKQEFVSQWQDDYNSISDKLRADQDVQAELLLRLYSLRECLWDIADQRKEEAERERLRVMGSGWLQDHLGILLNLYTTLMQVEVDRFQDTSRFLQDYYKGMEGEIPLEDITGFARIPLVNVADVQLPSSTSQEQNSAPGSSQHGGQRELRISVPSSKGSEEQESEEEGGLEIRPCRVPLVPYRVPSSTLAVKDKGRSPVKVTGRTKEEVVADAPPINVDEYLIFEAYHTATSTLSNLIQREVKIREDEEKTLKEERENDQIKSSAGKDGKKKSAEKKGHRPTSPLQPTQVEDPQDVQRRKQRERMFTEYLGALEDEACAVTTRLELIKGKLLAAIQELKAKADAIFTAMEDSLGAQFLREMESIADLLAVGLEHVQAGAKMQYQLVLGSREFYINGDVKVTADPKPPPRPPTREVPKVGQLTVQQLCSLLQQFSLLSPTGIITRRAFIEALQDLVSHGLGSDQLPEPWCSVTYPQLLEMVQVLALDSDFLDWRQFLLSVAQPWPYPSLEQLLDTKKQFQDIDQAGSGFITQQEYDQVELWFTGDPEVKIPEEADEPLPFDRLRQLKQVFFSLFADGTQDPPQLDYNNMLLHFSSHQEPAQGLRRALSLCMGIPLAPVPAPSTYLQSEPCLTEGAAGMLVATGKDPASLSYEEKVPLSALFEIMNYGLIRGGDGHYQGSKDQGRRLLCKRFIQVYQELGSKQLEPVSFDVLLKHPVIVDVISNSTRFGQPDLQAIVQKRSVESERVASSSPEPSVELAPSTPH
ncbi:sperm flagellar protein 2 isoform X2 [Narcine bancroftii]|uniref:sperm flagellar protein 2 isoform X2 n=1 Tax=Narcine bancroftii TaxID=1343680 RepID=UPI003831E611